MPLWVLLRVLLRVLLDELRGHYEEKANGVDNFERKMNHIDQVDYGNSEHTHYAWGFFYDDVVGVDDNSNRCICCFYVGSCGAVNAVYVVDHVLGVSLAQNIVAKDFLSHHHARGHS